MAPGRSAADAGARRLDGRFVRAGGCGTPDRASEGAKDRRRSTNDESPLIGVELAGASMWVCRGADVATVTAIIKALKAAK
jgi:hypothetical protein